MDRLTEIEERLSAIAGELDAEQVTEKALT